MSSSLRTQLAAVLLAVTLVMEVLAAGLFAAARRTRAVAAEDGLAHEELELLLVIASSVDRWHHLAVRELHRIPYPAEQLEALRESLDEAAPELQALHLRRVSGEDGSLLRLDAELARIDRELGRALASPGPVEDRLPAVEAAFEDLRGALGREVYATRGDLATTEADHAAALGAIQLGAGTAPLAALAILLPLLLVGLRSLQAGTSALLRGTEALAAGDLDAQIVPAGARELAELCTRFNGMARRLKEGLARQRDAEVQRELSRQAGMSEVATSVLHNVGNVLNSLNVGATVLEELARSKSFGKLAKACELLPSAPDEVARFFVEDPRARLLPEYLRRVGAEQAELQERLAAEIGSLQGRLGHVKAIVAAQQRLAKRVAVDERIGLRELLDSVVQLSGIPASQLPLELRVELPELPPLVVDRHKLAQILLNLLSNARNAVLEGGRGRGVIRVRGELAEGRLALVVGDDGVGILAANLPKLFSFGFTTRPNGHGFGLHASAIAAQELGGRLSARSEGPGAGSEFTLELAIRGSGTGTDALVIGRPAAQPSPLAAPPGAAGQAYSVIDSTRSPVVSAPAET